MESTDAPTPETQPKSGWILYDDSCGFCRRWVPYWEPALRRRGFGIAPLQSPWVAEKLDLPLDQLIDDLRLLLPDGTQAVGPDVYRQAFKRIWWAYPCYLLACAPGLRNIFDWGYRTFATNRYRISKSCGLPGAAEPTSGREADAADS